MISISPHPVVPNNISESLQCSTVLLSLSIFQHYMEYQFVSSYEINKKCIKSGIVINLPMYSYYKEYISYSVNLRIRCSLSIIIIIRVITAKFEVVFNLHDGFITPLFLAFSRIIV